MALNCTATVVQGYSESQVDELLREAAVVVDDCLVGSERMPIEAVLCGAVMLTRRCGNESSIPHARDFPIPRRNILPSGLGSTRAAGARYVQVLARVLRDLEGEARDYAAMRTLYTEEISASSLRREASEWLHRLSR